MVKYFITVLLFLIGFNGFSQVDTTKVDTLSWEELMFEQEWVFNEKTKMWVSVPMLSEKCKSLDSSVVLLTGYFEYQYNDPTKLVFVSGEGRGVMCRRYHKESTIVILCPSEKEAPIGKLLTVKGRLLIDFKNEYNYPYSLINVESSEWKSEACRGLKKVLKKKQKQRKKK